MSAVSQMEDVKNIHWTESVKDIQVGHIAIFGGKPAEFTYTIRHKEPRSFFHKYIMEFPLFNLFSPVFILPGLKGWEIEKIEERENTFRLIDRRKKSALDATDIEIRFDSAGRLLSCQYSDTEECLCTITVMEWVKVNGKEFPARAEFAYIPGRKELWSYTNWQFNLPEDEVRKIIEEKQKQSNNQPVKERSNP